MKKSYPDRLFHKTPSWVEGGAIFHIRIRCASENDIALHDPKTAEALLRSAQFYAQKGRWFIHLMLLMPDHLHALISFPKDQVMSRVIGDWKRYQTTQLGIVWQDNFFDHRLRNAAAYIEKADYIRNNPVVKNLCATEGEWALKIDPFRLGGTQPPGAF
jgi:REP element-mobilizing transposase RayT